MEGGILSVSQSVSPLRFGEGRQMEFCQPVSLSVPHIWRRMEDGILSVSQSVSSLIFGDGWKVEFCQSVRQSPPCLRKMKGQILSVSQSVSPPYIWRGIEDGILSVSQFVCQSVSQAFER